MSSRRAHLQRGAKDAATARRLAVTEEAAGVGGATAAAVVFAAKERPDTKCKSEDVAGSSVPDAKKTPTCKTLVTTGRSTKHQRTAKKRRMAESVGAKEERVTRGEQSGKDAEPARWRERRRQQQRLGASDVDASSSHSKDDAIVTTESRIDPGLCRRSSDRHDTSSAGRRADIVASASADPQTVAPLRNRRRKRPLPPSSSSSSSSLLNSSLEDDGPRPSPSVRRRGTFWICSLCTLQNPGRKKMCEACGLARTPERATKRAMSTTMTMKEEEEGQKCGNDAEKNGREKATQEDGDGVDGAGVWAAMSKGVPGCIGGLECASDLAAEAKSASRIVVATQSRAASNREGPAANPLTSTASLSIKGVRDLESGTDMPGVGQTPTDPPIVLEHVEADANNRSEESGPLGDSAFRPALSSLHESFPQSTSQTAVKDTESRSGTADRLCVDSEEIVGQGLCGDDGNQICKSAPEGPPTKCASEAMPATADLLRLTAVDSTPWLSLGPCCEAPDAIVDSKVAEGEENNNNIQRNTPIDRKENEGEDCCDHQTVGEKMVGCEESKLLHSREQDDVSTKGKSKAIVGEGNVVDSSLSERYNMEICDDCSGGGRSAVLLGVESVRSCSSGEAGITSEIASASARQGGFVGDRKLGGISGSPKVVLGGDEFKYDFEKKRAEEFLSDEYDSHLSVDGGKNVQKPEIECSRGVEIRAVGDGEKMAGTGKSSSSQGSDACPSTSRLCEAEDKSPSVTTHDEVTLAECTSGNDNASCEVEGCRKRAMPNSFGCAIKGSSFDKEGHNNSIEYFGTQSGYVEETCLCSDSDDKSSELDDGIESVDTDRAHDVVVSQKSADNAESSSEGVVAICTPSSDQIDPSAPVIAETGAKDVAEAQCFSNKGVMRDQSHLVKPEAPKALLIEIAAGCSRPSPSCDNTEGAHSKKADEKSHFVDGQPLGARNDAVCVRECNLPSVASACTTFPPAYIANKENKQAFVRNYDDKGAASTPIGTVVTCSRVPQLDESAPADATIACTARDAGIPMESLAKSGELICQEYSKTSITCSSPPSASVHFKPVGNDADNSFPTETVAKIRGPSSGVNDKPEINSCASLLQRTDKIAFTDECVMVSSITQEKPCSLFGKGIAESAACLDACVEPAKRDDAISADTMTVAFEDPCSGSDVVGSKDAMTKVGCHITGSIDASLPHIEFPLCSMGFKTAGIGKDIVVSPGAVAKASHLLEERETEIPRSKHRNGRSGFDRLRRRTSLNMHKSHSAVDSSVACFRTAGKGTTVAVSSEALAKANRLFCSGSTSDNLSHADALPLHSAAKTSGLSRDKALSEESMAGPNDLSSGSAGASGIGLSCSSLLVGFKTAGTGKDIAVSPEAVANASRLLEERAVDEPCGKSALWTAGSADGKIETEHIPRRPSSGMLVSQLKSQPPIALFKTAGKGKHVLVSSESLAKASRLFDTDASARKETVLTEEPHPESIVTTGSGISDVLPNEMKDDAKRLSDGSADMPSAGTCCSVSFGGFKTAGTGKDISVSPEALSKASCLLGERETEAPGRGISVPMTAETILAPKGSRDRGDHLLRRTSSNVPETCAESVAVVSGFKNAGSGMNFSFSSEPFAKADRSFHAGASAVAVSCPEITRTSAAFVTAGSRKSISVSEEAIARANDLFGKSTNASVVNMSRPLLSNGFKNAGTGKNIAVSPEAVEKASCLLGEFANDASKRDSFPPVTDEIFSVSADGRAMSDCVFRRPSLDSHEPKIHFSIASFKTAGKGKNICVSSEALAKANQLFCADVAAGSSVFPTGMPSPASFAANSSNKEAATALGVGASSENMEKKRSHLFKEYTTDVPAREFLANTSGERKRGENSAVDGLASMKKAKVHRPFHVGAIEGPYAAPSSVDLDKSFSANSGDGDVSILPEAVNCDETLPMTSTSVSAGQGTDMYPKGVGSPSSIPKQGESKDVEVPEHKIVEAETSLKAARMKSEHDADEDAPHLSDVSDHAIDPSSLIEQGISAEASLRADDGTDIEEELTAQLRTAQVLIGDDNYSASTIHAVTALAKTRAISPPAATRMRHAHLTTEGGSAQDPKVKACKSVQDHFSLSASKSDRSMGQDGIKMVQSCCSRGKSISQTPCTRSQRNNPALVTGSAQVKNPYAKGKERNAGKYNEHIPITPIPFRIYPHASRSEMKQQTSGAKGGMANGFAKHESKESVKKTHSTKVSLRMFETLHGPMEIDPKKSLIKGVSCVTLQVNSINATKLRFDAISGLPCAFLGDSNFSVHATVGSVAHVFAALGERGCDKFLLSNRWISNHMRWIIWKLSSTERRFPDKLAGKYLTYDHVLSQLQRRYQRELCDAERPALRKILNRDLSPGRLMILCVSQILRFKTAKKTRATHDAKGAPSTQEEVIRLELTDGWYSVQAVIDEHLVTFVERGKILVGTKLLVSNATLLGAEEGVDPLDEAYSSSKRDSQAGLGLTANATRIAAWDSKLGIVHNPPANLAREGVLLVKSLLDVIPGGGTIPSIELVVCRRYPRLFRETKIKKKSDTVPEVRILTESQEEKYQRDFERRRLLEMEKAAETATLECAKEIDEQAPEEWKSMTKSQSPSDFFEGLSFEQKEIVNRWTQRRSVLIQDMTRKEVDSVLECDESMTRESTPFIRVRVMSYQRNKGASSKLFDDERDECSKGLHQSGGIFTLWRVTEEHVDLLKEGSVICVKNVGVKSSLHDGLLQLTAMSSTQIRVVKPQPPLAEIKACGYHKRGFLSIAQSHIISRKLFSNFLHAPEVDVVGSIIKAQREIRRPFVLYRLYLTDISGFVLRLQFEAAYNEEGEANYLVPLWFSAALNTNSPEMFAFKDVSVLPFDREENCSVALWTQSSCYVAKYQHEAQQATQNLSESSKLIKCAGNLTSYSFEAGIPFFLRLPRIVVIGVGYILGFRMKCRASSSEFSGPKWSAERSNDRESAVQIVLDLGHSSPTIATLSFHTLTEIIDLYVNSAAKMRDVPLLSLLQVIYKRERCGLFRVLLTKKNCGIPSFSDYELLQMRRIESKGLAWLHTIDLEV